ncbi:4-(cytidine 5'-diphospho)-2-C-methyl-D-erythritol kinase [Salimicrobium album]|uniref:4-diphosphocytidyl-2-C-methyl-D-erythritol kinase n=1 Tax=Salimicrobium album TaxID=50717 RepID=A0A1H3J8N5_9BACI|nr:4-(cytidine 5'-diphospho)-2-C-methyl-D-erythritol kinase [Salimicrobium album]SDY35945.1 4-diphosphocytidyl-2-C-methyl-D-erythritol kinase [Salimicrobium album]
MYIMEKAPAKINLSLDVLHKRKDGFHEVEMVMTTIDLADRIELTSLKKNKIVLEAESRYVPNDERNLAYLAAKKMKKHYSITGGVHIKLTKHVPVAAGLAGGSSDAAAVLRGMARLFDLDTTPGELAEIGAEIGSDVSFCVHGGTALATGRGEKIEELPAPPPCWVVLAKPPIGVSTKTIYQALDVKEAGHPDTSSMVEALRTGDYEKMCQSVGNTLEGVTVRLYPEVAQLKEHMLQAGADTSLMSGSGPTVFSLVEPDVKARRICNHLKGFCDEVYMVRVLGTKETLD